MTDKKFEKVAAYIGLCQRAGAVLYGEDAIENKFKSAKLILVDKEASEKYTARIHKKFDVLPIFEFEGLRKALHKEAVNAVAITNESLANAIIDILR
ncbi:MAG: hypothetical protein IJ226_05045 [Clostridia bacterium]|nr:hypothetical protein [Clostridia bacterium]